MGTCLFCGNALNQNREVQILDNTNLRLASYNCNYCGEYWVDLYVEEETKNEDNIKVASYLQSRKLRDFPIIVIFATAHKAALDRIKTGPSITVKEILDEYPVRVTDKLNRALLNLEKLPKYFGQTIAFDQKSYPLVYAIKQEELYPILLALKQMSYIDGSIGTPPQFVITTKGYERIYELSETNVDSKQAFVAMWFDPSLNDAYTNGFQKAIEEDKKYKARRIDREEFNNKIDDEIVSEIRRSKFLIADFTGERGGVYYEAGFGHGLGIPVIFTCRNDWLEKVHFDTRQYNHIDWKTPEDLYKKLLNRIRATIG